MNKYILLTIDVEDWFQVENFKPYIPFSSWPEREIRVERNTHRILDLFDSIKLANSGRLKATFFVLGWIAERFPELVKEIIKRGHEVASHGYDHHLSLSQTPDAFREDLVKAKEKLEDIAGTEVVGYRAPSFVLNDDVLEIIKACGYTYDASYNSFDKHGRYGRIDLGGSEKFDIAYKMSDHFFELPVSNLKIGKYVIPFGGGGYFRLMPVSVFLMGVRSIIKNEGAFVFYMHPWEIDPGQPRVTAASRLSKFRHYVNIDKTYDRLKLLMETFRHLKYVSCREYLEKTVSSH